MKMAKVILSVVAIVSTLITAFTMKNRQFTGGHRCYTTVVQGRGNCEASDCLTLNSHAKGTNCGNLDGVRFWTRGCSRVIATWCTNAN